MNLEGTILSEINQADKVKYCMKSFICGLLRQRCRNTHTQTYRHTDTHTPRPHRYREEIGGVGCGIGDYVQKTETSSYKRNKS